jgi:peptidoglycan/LPS O-acetylase OafA/YrhL
MLKLRYIDALRGWAILGVIMVHSWQAGSASYIPPQLNNILVRGSAGVQLFFFISAFTLFLSANAKYGTEQHFTGNFFIRRFFRIAPMYYLAIIYFLWQDGFGPRHSLGDAPGITVENIIGNVLFLHGFNPTWLNSTVPGGWSVAVEMLFYLFVPVLFHKIKNTQQAAVFFILSLIFRFILDNILHRHPLMHNEILWSNYLFFYFPSQLPAFALGIIFYFIIKDNYQIKIKPSVILLAALILMLRNAQIDIIPDYLLCTIAFLLLALALSKFEFKIIVNQVTRYIGKISFSIYLINFAVIDWLKHFQLLNYFTVQSRTEAIANYTTRFLLVLVVCIFIASFLFYFIELPAQKIGYRIIKKRESKQLL